MFIEVVVEDLKPPVMINITSNKKTTQRKAAVSCHGLKLLKIVLL